MHQYVEFLFRESEASKKISFCANSKKSLMSNSTDKLHSPATVYFESDDEDSNYVQPITNQTKTGLQKIVETEETSELLKVTPEK